MEEEHVLVIPSSRVSLASGYTPYSENEFCEILDSCEFRPRSEVEYDESVKQLIPYVILQYEDELFDYYREGGESRLHAKRSIGVGGHISRVDGEGDHRLAYFTGKSREVEEELDIQCSFRDTMAGFVYDDSSPVGRVHIGVVHIYTLNGKDVYAKEDCLANSGFTPIEELKADMQSFEAWSQMCLEKIFFAT